jgi:DNA invertase Pin-like site-specific DNA recombinase
MAIFSVSSPKYVAYYRVSTDKQGRSGLGLEAQTATIETFAHRSGGEILATFREVESGKRSDRPELLKALALCRQKKAILIIAKLDRLSRNVAFIANLMESRVEFVACDMPEANKLTLHIMAAMAQHEREATSKRTKEALAAAKARGQILGSPKPGSKQGSAAWIEQTQQFRSGVYPLVRQMRDRGLTLRQIAQELNERHISTCNGRAWYAATISRLLKEAENTIKI